jgi:pimeloyl-ACP methyl ester carboxylesterase
MLERDVAIGDRTVRVRELGDPAGTALVHFHGTPSSRLELDHADGPARDLGLRVVVFDRPGYGGSTAAPYSLTSIAKDAAVVADALGISGFAASGQSGGGPFALACAAVLPDRVTRVGVLSGAAPFQQVPGLLETLDDNDRAGLALLPGDPDAAAKQFAEGGVAMRAMILDPAGSPLEMFAQGSDAEVARLPGVAEQMNEAFRVGLAPGLEGFGWDNVAWIGAWDFALSDVRSRVHLWYGEQDTMVPAYSGRWLAEQLADAHYVERVGEGHMGVFTHIEEILRTLKG